MTTKPTKISTITRLLARKSGATIAQLQDATSWQNATTGSAYNGINILVLWTQAIKHARASGLWATYRQWSESGAQVRKGAKGARVVYVGTLKRDDEAGEDDKAEGRKFLKSFTVFNADQVEGFELPGIERPGLAERIENAERFVSHTGAVIEDGHNLPHYSPARDIIGMLDFDRFFDTDTSTATAFAACGLLRTRSRMRSRSSAPAVAISLSAEVPGERQPSVRRPRAAPS